MDIEALPCEGSTAAMMQPQESTPATVVVWHDRHPAGELVAEVAVLLQR
jgi:hypothetical protein